MSANNQLMCPGCQRPLTQVRTSKGIFWSCQNCGGRAIGVELLRHIFTPESINPLWLHAIKGEGQSGRSCPSCRNSMIEVKLSNNAEIKVDVCRLCHFVWFDAKEVENLVPRAGARPKPEIPQKAREAIAMLEIERLAKEARGGDYDFDSAPPDEWWKQIAAFLGI
jgi:Zn-finger nucleic acid-binding protein